MVEVAPELLHVGQCFIVVQHHFIAPLDISALYVPLYKLVLVLALLRQVLELVDQGLLTFLQYVQLVP